MANAKIDTKEAIKEINNLIEQFNLLIKATGDVSTISKANFRKVETALEGLRKVAAQSNSTFNQLNAAQKRVALAANNEAIALGKTVTKLNRSTQAANDAAISQDKLEKNTKKTTSTIGGLLGGLKSLIGAFGIVMGFQLFANIIVNAYELTKKFNSLQFALERVTQDMFDTAASSRYLLDLTANFGVELVTTTERWIKFLAASKQAGMTLLDTEQIFKSVTKAAAVLGLGTDDLKSVYLALEQMMSKGKITTEELRRQLGEKLPGAVGIMAEAIGVNVNQLDSMLKKGEVLSAEVLPKFARALEQAYGIENVENIDTIAASQNRLTNAWEVFIKSISEGNSVISKIFNGIAIQLTGIAKFFMSEEQKIQYNMIQSQKDFQDAYEAQAEAGYDKLVSAHKKMYYLRNLIDKTQEDILKAKGDGSTSDEKIKLQKQLEEYRFQLAHGNELILNIQKHQAQKDIKIAQDEYNEKKFIYEKAKKDFEAIPWYKTQHGEKNIMDKAAAEYSAATGKLEYLRKLTEVSNVTNYEKPDKTGRKPATFEVKPVKDLSNEVAISALKNQQELNNELLAGDKASYEERQKAAMDNVGIGLELAQKSYDEEIEKADSYYVKMLDDLEDAIRKGSIIEGDQLGFREDLKKNYNDATILATQNQNKAVLNVEQKFAEEQLKLAKLVEDNKIAISDSIYNKQVIAAKEAYNASNKTAEDQKKLDEALTKASIEQGNAQIEIRIATLESLLEYGDLTETQTKDTILLIEKLKASLQTFKPGNDLKEEADKLIGILELVGEAAQAITDLGSAIFDRKIENINAEIEAEKNKYDTLIDLAKNNKDEQVRLQAEKDAKIKELEAKRLKEEQKKAKFEKANAIIQIAINTAIAVSKAMAQTGIGFVVPVPLIIALGAIQAATVLAQPIPKYKDGLKNASKDHLGMINDGGRQEFIERDGNILTTSTKNAIINLKKGDTVHKSYEDLVGNDMFSNISRSILLNNLYSKDKILEVSNLEKVFDKNLKTLNKDLKQGIRDGFKNVNIHNHTSYDAEWIKFKNNTL